VKTSLLRGVKSFKEPLTIDFQIFLQNPTDCFNKRVELAGTLGLNCPAFPKENIMTLISKLLVFLRIRRTMLRLMVKCWAIARIDYPFCSSSYRAVVRCPSCSE
jgi:hypothetical protein